MQRRKFLSQAPCAALSSVSVLNTILNLRLAGSLAAETTSGQDCRALVCLFLHGGHDSFNMLVPRGGEYANYANARSNLALPESSLLPLTQAVGNDGRLYGLHPNLTKVADMFNGTGSYAGKRRAAIVANVGTLVQPVTLSQYAAGNVPVPKALFSHSDQVEQWQTSVPQGLPQLTGWAGRAADVIHSSFNAAAQTSMCISLGGNNVLQVGNATEQFVISNQGSLSFTAPQTADANNLFNVKNVRLKNLVDQTYANTTEQAFANLTKKSVDAQQLFQSVFSTSTLPANVEALFVNGNNLAQTLRAAVRTIKSRQALKLRRQTIFISYGGHDLHGELLNTHAGMMSYLNAALDAYQQALELLGLQNDVVTFTCSDFGRTLRSNGRGTDHAWGGNALVFGGPVQGGKIYGTYPTFNQIGADLFGSTDVGFGGRMLPTTSTDAYFAEMLRWFGVPAGQMQTVLPNVSQFWNPTSSTGPLGFLSA
jgi:uncharacterized protein (DUF1501 family)